MTEAVALTPPAAPASPAPVLDKPATQAADAGTLLTGGGAPPADGGTTPPAGDAPKVWDNWRQDLSGGDEKILNELTRVKSPADIGKELLRQKQELSKRREPLTLAKDATPEQVAEYRKTIGVPSEGTLEAYGIKAPDGYKLSEVEKGALGDLAKLGVDKNVPAPIMKEMTDYFFRVQEANRQALNTLDANRQREWQGELEQKLGKDFKPMVAAGEAFLNQRFADNPEAKAELLNARLPGGGKLGDSPFFIELVIDNALKHGFNDRIEANELESNGRSLAEQQQELEKLQFSDSAKYNLPATQQKLDKIIAARLSRGEIDDSGNEVKKRRA